MNAQVVAVAIAFYAVLLTLALVHLKRRDDGGESAVEIRRLAASLEAPKERISALSEAEKILQARIPWWERSLSTIGVIAFFSMSLAAGIQTVNASIASGRVERSKAEVEALKAEREAAQALVRTSATVVLDRYRESGRLEHAAREVLRYRSEALARLHEPSPAELIEEYEISLVLGDFHRAVAALEKNAALADETVPAERLSLAEYYYLTGANELATPRLRDVEPHLSALPWQTRMRAIVLGVALGGSVEDGERDLAQLLRVGPDQASRRLSHELANLSRTRHEHANR